MKAIDKINALKAAGVNVDNLFSLNSTDGREYLVKLKEGATLVIVPEDDSMFNTISSGGAIPNRDLFRRWIMSQVFHMMTEKVYGTDKPVGFHAAIKKRGARYSWRVVINDFEAQSRMLRNGDLKNYHMRHAFFNKEVVVGMMIDYLRDLKAKVRELSRNPRHCKGIPYITLEQKHYFISDVERKLYKPIKEEIRKMKMACGVTDLLTCTKAFVRHIDRVWFTGSKVPVSNTFVDAYKGAGAYFTMRNLIMFHGARLRKNKKTVCSERESLKAIDEWLDKAGGNGYKIFAVLKTLLADNNIDIEAKMAGWRKEKKNKD